MTRTKKIFYLIMILAFVIGNYVLLTAMWPAIQDMIGLAQSDPQLTGAHATDFLWYHSFVDAAPWWLYFLPAVVGIVEAIIVMRVSEKYIGRRG
jgi:hypothetical protein